MKIIAFAASTSTQSINKKLVSSVARQAQQTAQESGADVQLEILDLNDCELPLFSEDLEREIGQPQAASDFIAKLGSADYLIVSFAEHNGLYSAAFKNLFDWCSRQAGRNIYQNKAMLLLATSPGGRGGKSVLELATGMSPRFGGEVKASVSVPSFEENFDQESQTISNPEIAQQINAGIAALFAD
ncbi:MAG: NAD(P)H-dependent oxidoreductase [Pseudomonadota bacterium]